ncbi:CPBP family intramembrane glutamic endopeptidase [Neptunitalea lumnitzerae]|uniref:Abortive infection protein n=1 Tax=Neptunitalea lumnitzerae TaxID=2965509 RepID=A0ABQ5MIF7_9FLAO|nr:CPBP family intramembrane glutamic endopeptidase [Neptunitalea sp. Y10]GLB49179.1 abortive infection protein [Neptunitalea sp. Y10]
MFIKQALQGKNDWFGYLGGFVFTMFSWQLIGALPLLIVLMQKNLVNSSLAQMANTIGFNNFLILNIISFGVGLLGLFFWVTKYHGLSILKLTTTRTNVNWKRVFLAFLVVAITSAVQVYVDYGMHPESYEWNFNLDKFLVLLGVVLLLPIQTSFEEYLFRGYLMQGIGVVTKTKWLPLVVTSVVFGLMHLGNPEVDKLGPIVMVYYIGTGFSLAIMTLMDEGMELALGFHAANNMIGALLVTADWSAIQTDSVLKDISTPEMGMDVLFPIVSQILILVIFAKIFKWNDWKGKLFGKLQVQTNETTN